MKQRGRAIITALAGILIILAGTDSPVAAQDKPNIVVIMGDDIGWSNIGAYNRGIMCSNSDSI